MKTSPIIGLSKIVTAFEDRTIGTKVVEHTGFLYYLKKAVRDHDSCKDRAEGQHFIILPEQAIATVSSGIGKATGSVGDYVVRKHRGQVNLYLKREFASDVNSVAAVMYTKDAYYNDPEVDRNEMVAKIARQRGEITHILVAVLASPAGPPSPLTPFRFVSNLADGNREAALWTADEIRDKARDIIAYWSAERGGGWHTVAD